MDNYETWLALIQGSEGLGIENVDAGSAAFKMGLQKGDIITYYNNSRMEDFFKVSNSDELLEAFFKTRLSETVTLRYISNGVTLTTSSETLD